MRLQSHLKSLTYKLKRKILRIRVSICLRVSWGGVGCGEVELNVEVSWLEMRVRYRAQ